MLDRVLFYLLLSNLSLVKDGPQERVRRKAIEYIVGRNLYYIFFRPLRNRKGGGHRIVHSHWEMHWKKNSFSRWSLKLHSIYWGKRLVLNGSVQAWWKAGELVFSSCAYSWLENICNDGMREWFERPKEKKLVASCAHSAQNLDWFTWRSR